MVHNLKLYEIDMKYVRDLSKVDSNVMSVSPQIGKSNRPFVGILVLVNGQKYCVPLSSPKPKFENKKNSVDFMRILDESRKNEHGANIMIGALNFNNMLPVTDELLKEIDTKIRSSDSPQTVKYKKMLTKQLDWCQKNEDAILSHANKLYTLITEHPERNRNLTRRCCNFQKLEAVLNKNRAVKNISQTKTVGKKSTDETTQKFIDEVNRINQRADKVLEQMAEREQEENKNNRNDPR